MCPDRYGAKKNQAADTNTLTDKSTGGSKIPTFPNRIRLSETIKSSSTCERRTARIHPVG